MYTKHAIDNALSLRETQLAALEVLKSIDAICAEIGVRYWLAYGTLIGALRHQGFIPWDDDVDICMPRPDYERLVRYFQVHKADLDPLVAITNGGGRVCPFLITRISDTRYRMVGEHAPSVPELGAFVDIYPLDGLGDDYRVAWETKAKCLDLMVLYSQAGYFAESNEGASAAKRFMKKLNSVRLGNPLKYADRQRELLSAFDFDTSKYVSVAIWGRLNAGEVFRADLFKDSIPVRFEDMTSWAPCGYDEILRGFYRDVWGEEYMALPPDEEQVPHHTYRLVARDM